MYGVLHSLVSFLKPHSVNVDNVVFQFHYRLTCLFLIGSSFLVTFKQFFGEPIDCFTSNSDDIPKSYLNTYCWMQSTFILPGSLGKRTGVDVAYPGIEKFTNNQDRIYMKYYQWVCFFLVFQAICFYLPRFLWKSVEGGKMLKVATGLNNPIQNLEEKNQKMQHLAGYIIDNLGGHRKYTLGYYLCEALNFVNVVAQIFFTDRFLGGEFLTYGSDVLAFTQTDQENRYDPMIRVFPRVTKCSIHKFGPSGDVQKHDALCILSLNIINEKIFVFIWFWFVLLATISGVMLLYRILWVSMRRLRYQVLLKFGPRKTRANLSNIGHKLGFGDWFFLHLLSKNIHTLNFRDMIAEMDRMLEYPGNGNAGTGLYPSHPDTPSKTAPFLEKA